LFPKSIQPIIDEIELATQHFNALQINFLFCYGSRQEIIGGIKSLIKKIKAGLISEDEISEESFFQHLWTANIPEPDLIIRTGGAVRLSNFLLYQAAYSEFYFLDCFWPDIQEQHLVGALNYFNECKRNFGT
jgi:undecaprenyl diphosphate synthase